MEYCFIVNSSASVLKIIVWYELSVARAQEEHGYSMFIFPDGENKKFTWNHICKEFTFKTGKIV